MDVAVAVGLRAGAEFLGRNDLIVTIVLANVSHHFAAVGTELDLIVRDQPRRWHQI
jgi:hypothetical protein